MRQNAKRTCAGRGIKLDHQKKVGEKGSIRPLEDLFERNCGGKGNKKPKRGISRKKMAGEGYRSTTNTLDSGKGGREKEGRDSPCFQTGRGRANGDS